MGSDPPKSAKNEFEKFQDDISKIQFYLNNYRNEIVDLCKTENDLEKEIRIFQINYSQFQDLERFSIPIIGKISSGKSTLLNIILDLKDSLQVQSKTTTKFISIIRHNSALEGKNPKIYSVKFTQRSNLKDHYNFEKDEFIDEDIKTVIEKRNLDLIHKNIPDIPQNYFYIIENYIPFFSGEKEKYANLFEFLDIPGLNENSDNINNDNIYYDKVLPLIINNIKFSLYIFETKKYQNAVNSIKLYKRYINMLNSRNKDYFDITKNINDIQRNSIYILNKIDYCDKKGGLEKEKEDFKKFLENDLDVNLKINKVILISAKDSILEENKNKSFDDYLNYVIKSKKIKEHFIPNLKERFKNDFSIDIKENIDDDDDEDEDAIIKLNEDIQKNGFFGSMNKKQYDIFKEKYESNRKYLSNSKSVIENLRTNILELIHFTYNNYVGSNEVKSLKNIIEKTFIKDQLKVYNKNLRSEKISSEKILNNKNYNLTLKKFGSIFDNLKFIEPEHDYIKQMYNNYQNAMRYIYEDYKYRIMLIGGVSSGKSSIINSLIGYNLDLLPKSSDHCTKIILIIQYINNEDNIALYKTKFDKHNEYSSFYFFSKENLITKGKENVKIKLNELNTTENLKEIPYYILQTPIEFLDNNISDINKKHKIEFIDLPGINSENELLENEFLSNLIKYSELFLFINDKNIIEEENKEIIIKFFYIILTEKMTFDLNSILFVVNQIDLIPEIGNKENLNKIMEEFSEEINNLYREITRNDWNNYLKYSKILKKEEKIECTYFSSAYFKFYKKTMNYEEMIKSIIKDHDTKSIKAIMKYLKKDYLNLLENKKEYNPSLIKDFDSNIESFREVMSKNNFNDGEIKQHLEEINEVVKIYSFVKLNPDKIKYNYNFNNFIFNIKERITKENLYIINFMVLKLIDQLNNDFQRINENLWRYETNLTIEFHETKELKDIYEEFRKRVEEKYKKEKKELEKIVEKIVDEKKNNEKYYKEFEKKLNKLNDFFIEVSKLYYEKMNKTHQKQIEQYSKEKIFKNEYLFNIEFYEDSNYLEQWGNGIKYCYLLGSIFGFAFDMSCVGIAAGAITGGFVGFGGGLMLFPMIFIYESGKYIYRNYSENKKREEKIRIKFKYYLNNLEIKKKKILTNINEIYSTKTKDIKMFKISQQNPMKQIYKNIETFEKIEEEFKNICLEFKK